MAKEKKTDLAEEAEKLKAELAELKKAKQILDKQNPKPAKKQSTKKKQASKETKTKTKKTQEKKTKKTSKSKKTQEETKPKKTQEETKPKKTQEETKPKKAQEEKAKPKKSKGKKTTDKKKEEIESKTLEEELEEKFSDAEIENFEIEKMDMEKLTNKVCEIIGKYESEGMLQSDLWKKLKLSSRDGSRLSLRLERRGIITREKILEKGRWTYKLILKKTPISTSSIENAPCLVCPVEQKCSIDGEISPKTCQWIEEWVLAELKKPKKSQ